MFVSPKVLIKEVEEFEKIVYGEKATAEAHNSVEKIGVQRAFERCFKNLPSKEELLTNYSYYLEMIGKANKASKLKILKELPELTEFM